MSKKNKKKRENSIKNPSTTIGLTILYPPHTTNKIVRTYQQQQYQRRRYDSAACSLWRCMYVQCKDKLINMPQVYLLNRFLMLVFSLHSFRVSTPRKIKHKFTWLCLKTSCWYIVQFAMEFFFSPVQKYFSRSQSTAGTKISSTIFVKTNCTRYRYVKLHVKIYVMQKSSASMGFLEQSSCKMKGLIITGTKSK